MSRFGFIAKRCKKQNELHLGARVSAYINNDRISCYVGQDGQGMYLRNFVKDRWYRLEYVNFDE